MGLFYANMTVCQPDRAGLLRELRSMKRAAFLSPTVNGRTVVFDRVLEDQDVDTVDPFLKRVTKSLSCAGLVALLHDDDVLDLILAVDGRIEDRYCSSPAYFDADSPHLPPAGGDSVLLCDVFQSADNRRRLRQLLRADLVSGKLPGVIGELERHRRIAAALSIPACAAGVCYSSIDGGFVPEEHRELDYERV